MNVADLESIWLEAENDFTNMIDGFEREFFAPFTDTQAAQEYDRLDEQGRRKLYVKLMASSPEVQEKFKIEAPSVWRRLREEVEEDAIT